MGSGSRPLPDPELRQLELQGLGDLGGALGEHLDQLTGHARDLRLSAQDGPERQPVAGREFGAQHGLVEAAQGPLVALQYPSVQRPPASVVGLHLGGDHQVGVELRIVGTRRARRKAATLSPRVSGCNMPWPERTRVVEPNRSR